MVNLSAVVTVKDQFWKSRMSALSLALTPEQPEQFSLQDFQFKSFFDSTTRVKQGLCPISRFKNPEHILQKHSLYYEQHGNGPEKVVLIMGLNTSSFAWNPQIQHFGRLPQYSVLTFDNRGVGYSDAPRGPYTTSCMAEDAVLLIDSLGWTSARSLHVVGISLGGMIAQELATRVPERIASLTLCVTTAGGNPWTNLPPWKGFYSLARLMTITEPHVKIPIVLDLIFPERWLAEKADNDPAGRTNREVQYEIYQRRIEITKPQTLVGSLSQMAAALTHNVSPARLHTISLSIPKVVIVTGDQDHLVNPRNSLHLKEHMSDAEYILFEATGHAIQSQRKETFNALLERVFKEGRERADAVRQT